MDMAMGGNLDERYMGGANSTDLTVRSGRAGDVDAIVSVAWSRGRLGGALLRLHSEFDGVARRGLKPEQMFMQLKALPEVRAGMLGWAFKEGIDQPEDLVAAILAWWLDKTCKTCNGTMWVTRPAKPKQPCTACHGTAEAPIPNGNEGRGLLNFVDDCLHRHRASIKGRLRGPR